MRLEPGMIFTIEPMINAGRHETKILGDGWTAVTRDRSLSAQFEHSIGITDGAPEIFTLSPAGYTAPPMLDRQQPASHTQSKFRIRRMWCPKDALI